MPSNKNKSQKFFSVWEGVFKSFKEANGDLDAFDSNIWINKQKDRINTGLENLKNDCFVSKDYPLPLVIAMMITSKKKISVLDFGGGMGLQYLEIISKVPKTKERINYYVVDGEKSLKNRPKKLNQFKNLHFFDNFNDIKSHIDIIHIGSTLQYIENWQSLLQNLQNKFKPKYFVFSDLLAGNIPSFVSHQLFYGKKIPVNMINIKNFENHMKNMCFLLKYKTFYQTPILGCNILPNTAITDNLKISMTLNLIFTKNKSLMRNQK